MRRPLVTLLLLLLMSPMATYGRRQSWDNSVHWPWDRPHAPNTRTLYIGGIFPMSGAWAGGRGCRPAVNIALEDINHRADLLPGFRLQMLANDSRVFLASYNSDNRPNNGITIKRKKCFYTSAHGSGRRYYVLLLKFLSFFFPFSFFSFTTGSPRWLYRQGTFLAQMVGVRRCGCTLIEVV